MTTRATARALRRAGPVLAGSLVVVASGCAFDVSPRLDGPLRAGYVTERNEVCIPSDQGRPITVGYDTATNTGDEALLVDGIELINPDGLEVVYASMWEIDGNLVGAQTAFPPLNAPELSAEADGHEWLVEPGEELSIVVGLRPTDRQGTADATRISYQTPDGEQFFAATSTSIIVVNDPSATCDDHM